MMRGYWYPDASSERFPAILAFKQQQFELRIEGREVQQGDMNSLDISDRVGNITRRITFLDGSLFETLDNDSVDKWLEDSEHEDANSQVLHHLESRWRWIILALMVTITLVWAFFRFGIPWTSEKIAYALPDATNQWIAEGTLETLDKYIFKESHLSEQRQAQIQQHFQQDLVPLQDGKHRFKLVFRYMPEASLSELDNDKENNKIESNQKKSLGDDESQLSEVSIPNAFALPSGEIVVTDRLIELANNQHELDSVLLHEMGHVEYRHSLRQLLESSLTTIAALFVIGDASALNSVALAMPSFLISNHYSRSHESQADQYAFEHMIKGKIDPIAFSTIMKQMETNGEDETESNKNNKDSSAKVLEYLSTHPDTGERIQQSKIYSERFKAQQRAE